MYGSSDNSLTMTDLTQHHLMLVNVNYCDSSELVERSLESDVILGMTLIRSLSGLDCPALDGTIYAKKPGPKVLELPLDKCRTLIESWADFEQTN